MIVSIVLEKKRKKQFHLQDDEIRKKKKNVGSLGEGGVGNYVIQGILKSDRSN